MGIYGNTFIKENLVSDVKQKVVNTADLKKQWKDASDKFVNHKWIYRYIDEKQRKKIEYYYEKLKSDDISYSDYKRYFKSIANFMGLDANKIIIENIVFEKDKKDKDQDIIAVKYSKGQIKVTIPEGVRLIHISPVENLTELVPSFRSKVKGKYLYPSKRVFFTVEKEIKPTQAGLEKTKTTKYTPRDQITVAFIDPTYSDFGSSSVFVETLKPIPVVKFKSLIEKIFKKKEE